MRCGAVQCGMLECDGVRWSAMVCHGVCCGDRDAAGARVQLSAMGGSVCGWHIKQPACCASRHYGRVVKAKDLNTLQCSRSSFGISRAGSNPAGVDFFV